MKNSIESLIRQLRWVVMSPKDRYSLLWDRTRVLIAVENTVSLRKY